MIFFKKWPYPKWNSENSGLPPPVNNDRSHILENPQFGGVNGHCYGYYDKLCDWWIKLSALNTIR